MTDDKDSGIPWTPSTGVGNECGEDWCHSCGDCLHCYSLSEEGECPNNWRHNERHTDKHGKYPHEKESKQ